MLQNISESGVSFRAERALPQEAEVEMIFVMPQEITGQPNSKVLCRGELVRIQGEDSGMYMNSVVMSGYSFLPDD